MAVFLLKMTESFGKKYGPRMVRINYRLSSVKKYLGGIFQASKRGLRLLLKVVVIVYSVQWSTLSIVQKRVIFHSFLSAVSNQHSHFP